MCALNCLCLVLCDVGKRRKVRASGAQRGVASLRKRAARHNINRTSHHLPDTGSPSALPQKGRTQEASRPCWMEPLSHVTPPCDPLSLTKITPEVRVTVRIFFISVLSVCLSVCVPACLPHLLSVGLSIPLQWKYGR